MAHGVPVLCFDQASGIADFLIDVGLKDDCVAGYLDSVDMAEKVLAFARSKNLRETVSEKCSAAFDSYFAMDKYVARLEHLSDSAREQLRQERVDVQTVIDSNQFRRDFSVPVGNEQTIQFEVQKYVRAWASGIGRRKPLPGFHPGVYLESHGLGMARAGPFADYLRAGCPTGPWNNQVIVLGNPDPGVPLPSTRVALHVHAYYSDLMPDVLARLANNKIVPDLFVSVKDEKTRAQITRALENYAGKVVSVSVVPNRGRDIGPLLTEFGKRLLADYDFIGHIHTKKTVDVKDAAVGQLWYQFLLDNLLGGDAAPSSADRILFEMESDASIGMIFPDEPNVVGWGANKDVAKIIGERIGIAELPENFVFPVGSMFWARSSALLPLLDLNLDWDDYPEEPLPYDGSALHAIERFFSLCVSLKGMRIATTNINGVTR